MAGLEILKGPDTDAHDEEVIGVGKYWADNPYYGRAEEFIYVFWDEGRPFRTLFDKLVLDDVIELACGHGRHTAQFVERAGHVTLSDIHAENIEASRRRLSGRKNVSFHIGDGRTLEPIKEKSVTSLFCYDAMVHFAPSVVFSYLSEIKRVLEPGALALLHHSNLDAPIDSIWHENPHGRNRMTREMFREAAAERDLEVLEMITMPWGRVKDLDCLSLVRA